MSNTFGHTFRITTFGESHAHALGVIVDGCPANKKIDLGFIQAALDRRRPGQSVYTTPRKEKDILHCYSGLHEGHTLGTPLCFVVFNEDKKPQDYQDINQVFRPSHADYTTWKKYGLRPSSGGGRASARETVARVIGGSVAEQILRACIPNYQALAFVDSMKDISASIDYEELTREKIEEHPLRCPDQKAQLLMEKLLSKIKKSGDSVGGTIQCIVEGCPPGWGEPVFDKLEANLAKAMMSLPASKGFEIGSGFASTKMLGSMHNDSFFLENNRVRTKTNYSGGVQGGISNGERIYFRVAFKPVSTIFQEQNTVDIDHRQIVFKPKQGRHDSCVLPRATVIVEAMTHLTLIDFYLRQYETHKISVQ